MELLNTQLINDAALRFYYRFESGALATDSSGSGLTLTTQQGTETGGRYGGGINYNQQKSLRSANMGIANATVTASWVAWVNINAHHNANNEVWLEHLSSASQFRHGSTHIVISYGGSDAISYAHSIATGTWHHYAVTHNGGTVKLYIDGVLVDSGARGGSGGNAQFSIGREFDDQDYVNAKMDDVAGFTKELSLAEIGLLANDFAGGMFLGGFV